MKPADPPRRSGFRTLLKLCTALWLVSCGLLVSFGLAFGGLAISWLVLPPVCADGSVLDPAVARRALAVAIATGMVAAPLILLGRQYLDRAADRLAELERFEHHTPP
ncbi:MAG TPA: hypothetical protein VFE24_10910 [Pirellulales bacterium]|jgi:hypothetical protein|nr:hypothetical protein [Pirellulales bacterium]